MKKKFAVALRPFTTHDIPILMGWMGEADAHEMLFWAGMHFTSPLTEIQIKDYLVDNIVTGKSRLFVIEVQKATNLDGDSKEVFSVGVIALGQIDRINRTARIGFVLIGNKEMRGKGLATQAVRCILDIGFSEEKLHKIGLGVFDTNIPALRCYTGLGFRRDGMLRDHFSVKGEYLNLIEMSILSSEWESGLGNTGREIETDRLILRSMTEADAPAALEFYQKNRAFHARWSPVRDESFYTLTGQIKIIQKEIELEQQSVGVRLWIFSKEPDSGTASDYTEKTAIGNLGLSQIVYGYFGSAFLGYQMDQRSVNKGFITEALAELLKIGFEEFSLHRIEANIMPENTASRAVAEKLGFKSEGISEKYLRIAGKWEDHIHYVLLKGE
ncbi:MAG: GNAT family N-acetyltransferase [Bacteroidetes bacterium]|nr:GNAT family N-acetyltransferase [Bacteroidota bacterium]